MEKSLLFDKNSHEEYYKDLWNPKYELGLFFSALHEINIPIYIDFFLKGLNINQWYKTHHALHDGFSALLKLNDELKLDFDIHEMKIRPPKNKVKAVINALRSKPSVEHKLKGQSPYTSSTDGEHFVFEAKRPLKTFEVLNGVAKIITSNLTSNTRSRWMIPTRISEKKGLQASYFGIEVDHDDSIEMTKEKFKRKLVSEEHWGFYFLAKLALKFGRSGVVKGTKKTIAQSQTLWLGSLSNLGNLGKSKMIDEMIILHPVRWHRPIGFIMYEFNARQFVTLKIHDSLLKNNNIEKLISEIDEYIRAL